ncbi:hypothetical protein [Nostoc sp. DedQUE07]|jgi:hypothetical protein|uniref:hypothetical protein n=1 Tax=Nostoc sp. DedQUE07 TaxID=3075392 RepID=UPI002AD44899|nr:hypothetical protein [Nostoc sp. DedQUE07]MDZ8127317.1 hypothetical protein [Nostoc sp. DedQUE07]
MSKHYYHSLGAAIYIAIAPIRKMDRESPGLFTSSTIDWQRARSPVSLIAHHKITALLTPLLHARWVMLNEAIPV